MKIEYERAKRSNGLFELSGECPSVTDGGRSETGETPEQSSSKSPQQLSVAGQ